MQLACHVRALTVVISSCSVSVCVRLCCHSPLAAAMPPAPLQPASVSRTSWSPDVYEPSDDSFALADAVLELLPQLALPQHPRCVEIGCGSGYVMCSLALGLQQLHRPCGMMTCTDVNPLALSATQATLAAHQVHGVELVQADLLTPLQQRLQQEVHLVLFNPPYVPTPDEEVERPGIARAWAGGHKGRRVVDRCLPQLASVVAVGGHVFMIVVPENDPQDVCNIMAQWGFQGSVVHKRKADEEFIWVLHLERVSLGGVTASML